MKKACENCALKNTDCPGSTSSIDCCNSFKRRKRKNYDGKISFKIERDVQQRLINKLGGRLSREMNNNKIILDLCGGTGSWSKPYVEAGYDVRLVTLPEQDVFDYVSPENVYGILAAPPCTMFSFARTNAKIPRDIRGGYEIVQACLDIIHSCQCSEKRLTFWALENPFGMLRWFLGNPPLTFNPYDYGDPYQKKTCIWGLFNLPKKKPIELCPEQKKLANTNSQLFPKYKKFDSLKTNEIHPEMYKKLSRQARRAITPKGFAKEFFKANK